MVFIRKQAEKGFSLAETVVTVAVLLVASTIAILNISSVVRNSHVDTAYQTTLMQLRYCRQTAIDKRLVCVATFTAPRTLVITSTFNDGTPPQVESVDLPADVSFTVVPGIPSGIGAGPDGIGLGNRAIDFDQIVGGGGTSIWFQPDGSALDATSKVNDGIVYVARPGEVMSSRAITLMGTSGRIRGWKLVTQGGKNIWQ
jgi:prepilin-type N-terminal cleavage/methylation domain-containing protein